MRLYRLRRCLVVIPHMLRMSHLSTREHSRCLAWDNLPPRVIRTEHGDAATPWPPRQCTS